MRFFLILTTLIASLNSNAQDFLWAQAFSPAPILSENTVAVDNASNVFFSTTFSYCIDADPGPGVDSFFAIQRVESFIAKLDQSGNYIWGKELDCGSTSDRNYVKDMAVDASGNVYAVGGYRGTIDFDPGNSVLNVSSGLYNDMFILKLDPAGNLVWVKTIGGSNHDSACAIKIDNSGNLLITGTFRDTVDFDPGAGAYVLISSGQSDVFFLKLDPNGDHIWSRREGSALNNDLAGSLDVDNIGNIYGLVSGGQQVSFSKMASNGAVVWTQQLTNPFNSNFAAEYIATDNAGNLCITGIFEFTTIDFDPGPGTFNMSYSDGSMFILKLDTSGTFQWAKQVAVPIVNGLSYTGNGNLVIEGMYDGTIDFDPNAGINNVTANGTFPDNFVLRLDAGGNFLSQCHIGNGDWTYGRDLALDGSDNIYLAGAFADMLDLDPGVGTYTVGTFPSYNAYVLKLSSSLNARNVFSVGVPAFIYPNPATDELTIKTEEQYQSYTISNSLGQQIIKADLRAKETKVDIRSLPPGLYYLNIIGENETNVRKFVKI